MQAREFYPFRIEGIQAMVSLNLSAGFEVSTINWELDGVVLKMLTDSLVKEKRDISDVWKKQMEVAG
jgi:hypothetical protein